MATAVQSLSPEESVRRVAHARSVILRELHQVIVGQDDLLEQLLIAVFAGGHCLLEGGAGTGKSLATRTLAKVLHLTFSQLHCHPDLAAEDVVGHEAAGKTFPMEPPSLQFQRGPIFANVVLADEFNRASHRAQNALLQPLCENRVTAGGNCYELAAPFLLIATKNVTEQQQVFPLSDAVTDRFLLCLLTNMPDREEERQIAGRAEQAAANVRQVMRPRDVLWVQDLARRIVATQHVIDYAVDLVRGTRPDDPTAPRLIQQWVTSGAGPRAAQAIVMAAKARAMMHGRCAVHAADVRAVLPNTLRHRLHWHPDAKKHGIGVEHAVAELIRSVSENSYGEPYCSPPELEVVDRGELLPPSE